MPITVHYEVLYVYNNMRVRDNVTTATPNVLTVRFCITKMECDNVPIATPTGPL